MLDEWKSGRRLCVLAILLFPRMRRMVRGNDIEPVVEQSLPQGLAIRFVLDGRIALDVCSVFCVIGAVVPQVMHADF